MNFEARFFVAAGLVNWIWVIFGSGKCIEWSEDAQNTRQMLCRVKFAFDGHTLDTERRELFRGDRQVALQPQVFDLLVYLTQNRDRVVSKDDLIALVWGGRIVSDSTLTSRINAARTAVGDSGKEQKLIRTIPRKGFRFVGDVTEQLDDLPTVV